MRQSFLSKGATTLTVLDRWKSKVCSHRKLLAALELLDLPNDTGLLRDILYGTNSALSNTIA